MATPKLSQFTCLRDGRPPARRLTEVNLPDRKPLRQSRVGPLRAAARAARCRRCAPRRAVPTPRTDAGGALGREASMPARWRAAPASRPALGREALDAPCRRAGCNAGGAFALICPPVWSKIRPGERGTRVTYVGFWQPALWCAALPVSRDWLSGGPQPRAQALRCRMEQRCPRLCDRASPMRLGKPTPCNTAS